MEAIINSVVLSSWDDENRFRVIIDAAIKAGEVPTFDAYEAGSKKKSKRSTAAARRRRAKEDQEEAKEAEELAQKLGLRAGGKRSDEDSLKQMILQNKGKSEARFSSVIAKYVHPSSFCSSTRPPAGNLAHAGTHPPTHSHNPLTSLEAKYGSKKEAKKAGGRKGTKDEGANEPTEEEFLALQKKLERGKAEQQEGGEKERSQKKRRISKEEDPHDNDTNEPTEEEFEQARRRLEQRKRDAAATQRRRPTKRRGGKSGK
jgi:DnaJ family protein C protein 9